MWTKLIIINFFFFIFSCFSNKPRKPINFENQSSLNESVERSKKLYEREHQQLKEYAKKSPYDFLESTHGFFYVITEKSKEKGEYPETGNIVIFDYNVKNLEDEVIYSFDDIGEQDILLDKQKLIYGLNEGIKLMKVNEKAIFLFSSHGAYGFHGDNDKISFNTPIVCEVHLKNIKTR